MNKWVFAFIALAICGACFYQENFDILAMNIIMTRGFSRATKTPLEFVECKGQPGFFMIFGINTRMWKWWLRSPSGGCYSTRGAALVFPFETEA